MSSKTESDNTVKSGKEGEASNRSSKLNDILSKIKNKNKAATENGTAGGGLRVGSAATGTSSKKNDSNNLDEPIVGAVATERLGKHTKNMINGDVTYSIIEYSNLHSRSPTGVAAIPLKIPPSLGGGLGVGVMAGAQMSQGGMNTTAMIQPQMAQTNMAQTQMMQSKDNIVINATDTFQGNVNLNITPDGSVNIQKTSAPPIAQTTQAPQQANVSKFTPKIPSK